MGLLGKIIAGKVVAKTMQKMKAKDEAAEAAFRAEQARQGVYIPANAPARPRTIANQAVDFYERNPKLVAAAGTLIMAALAAGMSRKRRI